LCPRGDHEGAQNGHHNNHPRHMLSAHFLSS
jgi:hypothetical protein